MAINTRLLAKFACLCDKPSALPQCAWHAACHTHCGATSALA